MLSGRGTPSWLQSRCNSLCHYSNPLLESIQGHPDGSKVAAMASAYKRILFFQWNVHCPGSDQHRKSGANKSVRKTLQWLALKSSAAVHASTTDAKSPRSAWSCLHTVPNKYAPYGFNFGNPNRSMPSNDVHALSRFAAVSWMGK